MNTDRRKFVKESVLASFKILIGAPIIYGHFLPKNILPIALKNDIEFSHLPGKSDLLNVLNDRPINAETPAHLLNDSLTPNNLFFVRNNGIPPVESNKSNWLLTVGGESVKAKKTYTINELAKRFEVISLNLTLECGGNGRKEFNPPAKGNQWGTGAVGCAKWTGVRLKDVLNDVGIKSDAVYIGYLGKDFHLSGDPAKQSISRGVPIDKAFEEESMIAWKMNDQDLPILNGYPLRLVFGGYPASCSGKWLSEIMVRNKVHDGQKMGGQSYRIPCDPIAPGTKVKDEEMCIIEDMPVKSLITYPKTGAIISQRDKVSIQGHAWTSANAIREVECSIDFGRTWLKTTLSKAENKYQWHDFKGELQFNKIGYYEVWARAKDTNGDVQPIILPGWNPKGYLNNACHRIAVKVVD